MELKGEEGSPEAKVLRRENPLHGVESSNISFSSLTSNDGNPLHGVES